MLAQTELLGYAPESALHNATENRPLATVKPTTPNFIVT